VLDDIHAGLQAGLRCMPGIPSGSQSDKSLPHSSLRRDPVCGHRHRRETNNRAAV